MSSILSIPKRITRAIWRVIRAIGIAIYIIFEWIITPIAFLWRLFD